MGHHTKHQKECGTPYNVSKHTSLTELGCRVDLALELSLSPELPPPRNFHPPLPFSVPVVIVRQDVCREKGRMERETRRRQGQCRHFAITHMGKSVMRISHSLEGIMLAFAARSS